MEKKIKGLNAEWHRQHKMPENPTLQQRIDWHLAHQQNCGCRPGFPAKLKEQMKKMKIKIPAGV